MAALNLDLEETAYAATPTSLRKLRACLRCKLIKTEEQVCILGCEELPLTLCLHCPPHLLLFCSPCLPHVLYILQSSRLDSVRIAQRMNPRETTQPCRKSMCRPRQHPSLKGAWRRRGRECLRLIPLSFQVFPRAFPSMFG